MGFGGTSPCAQQNGEIFIDKHPEELLMHGRFEPKPILFGTNKHEGSFVLGGKYLYLTVWKFQDFSITHILREINFEDSRELKIYHICIFRGSEF